MRTLFCCFWNTLSRELHGQLYGYPFYVTEKTLSPTKEKRSKPQAQRKKVRRQLLVFVYCNHNLVKPRIDNKTSTVQLEVIQPKSLDRVLRYRLLNSG